MLLVVMGYAIKTGMAIIIVNKAMFDPTALPNDNIGFLSIADVIPTTVSGREVATLTSKKLIV